MAAVRQPQRTQRLDQALAQRLVIGVAEVDMGDMLDIAGEIGVLASRGVVDQLVRHAQVPVPIAAWMPPTAFTAITASAPACFSAQRLAR